MKYQVLLLYIYYFVRTVVGIEPADFSNIKLHPQIVSLGGGGVALACGAMATTVNPAGLTCFQGQEYGIYSSKQLEATHVLVEGLWTYNRIPLGISYKQTYFLNVEKTIFNDESLMLEGQGDYLNYLGTQLMVASGYALSNHIKIGGAVEYLNETLHISSAKAIDITLGTIFKQSSYSLAFVIKRVLASQLVWTGSNSDGLSLKPTYMVGYSKNIMNNTIVTHIECDTYNWIQFSYNIGLRLVLSKEIQIDIGLKEGGIAAGTAFSRRPVTLLFSVKQIKTPGIDYIYHFGLVYDMKTFIF